MDKHLCLKIARRISQELEVALGETVDPQRMVDEPRYARDVLLVCDAIEDADLRQWARRYRRAQLADPPAPRQPEPTTGMGLTSVLNSIFGMGDEAPPEPTPAKPRRRGWLRKSAEPTTAPAD